MSYTQVKIDIVKLWFTKEREGTVLDPKELIIYSEVRTNTRQKDGRKFSNRKQGSIPTNQVEADMKKAVNWVGVPEKEASICWSSIVSPLMISVNSQYGFMRQDLSSFYKGNWNLEWLNVLSYVTEVINSSDPTLFSKSMLVRFGKCWERRSNNSGPILRP